MSMNGDSIHWPMHTLETPRYVQKRVKRSIVPRINVRRGTDVIVTKYSGFVILDLSEKLKEDYRFDSEKSGQYLRTYRPSPSNRYLDTKSAIIANELTSFDPYRK
ncbi:hypothetical protein HYALB_00013808 [Hymenoscyphus albidus]|uniref:Uncharacterized protein n=1 Tax=Hymenoscyphus albidus TaxID=595503 RepID=A0A9N9M0K3_9HELO|nr:hypothetical protein HYALB_00013808 [Hymenoscyphus albidus]